MVGVSVTVAVLVTVGVWDAVGVEVVVSVRVAVEVSVGMTVGECVELGVKVGGSDLNKDVNLADVWQEVVKVTTRSIAIEAKRLQNVFNLAFPTRMYFFLFKRGTTKREQSPI